MTENYNVTDLGPASEVFMLAIGPEAGSDQPSTAFTPSPPMLFDQRDRLLNEAQPRSKLATLLQGGTWEGEVGWEVLYTKFNTPGEPTPEDLVLGIELAQAVIALRGIKAAMITVSTEDTPRILFVSTIEDTPQDAGVDAEHLRVLVASR